MIDDINKAAMKVDTAAHNNESKEKVTELYNALKTLTTKTNEKLESMHPSKNPNIGTKTIESAVGSIDKGGAEALQKLQKVTSEFPGHLDRANAGLKAAYSEFEPKLNNFRHPEIEQATETLRNAVEQVYAVAFKAHTDACETRREIVAELNAKQKKNKTTDQ